MIMKKQKEKEEKTKYPEIMPLWLAIFSDILGFSLVIPLLPKIGEVFEANELQVLLLLSINALFGFIANFVFGRLSDKYGRRPLLLIAQVGTFSAFLMFAFSNSLEMLYVSRIIDGCFGGNFPIAKAIISDVVLPKDRSVQMTNVGVCHNLANLFGPALSGFLSALGETFLPELGNRAVLIGPGLLGAALSMITIVLTLTRIRETAPLKTGKTVFGSLEELKKEMDAEGNKRSILKNRTALLLLIQWSFHTASFFIFMSGLTLFASIKFNFSPQQLGIFLSISASFQIFIRYVIFYPMLRKIGEKRTATLGLTLFMPVFFLAGFVQAPWQFLLVLLGLSFAASSVRGVLTGFQSRSVDPRDIGKMQGYNTSLDTLAQIIGPLISASVLIGLPIFMYGFTSSLVALVPFLIIFQKFEFKYEKKFLNGRKIVEGSMNKEA